MVEIDARSVVESQVGGAADAFLLDIRREDEVAGITAEYAIPIPRDMLELRLDDLGIKQSSKIFLLCQSGARSLFAAQALRHFGYSDSWSVSGGYQSWVQQQLPTQTTAWLSSEARKRFARHISLGEFGIEGQARLADASVLLIGAGGLGSPAALYLAAMGVGRLHIIDDDVVELSNLQRQVVHRETTVGKPKVNSAADALQAINSSITVTTSKRRFEQDCGELVEAADVVINGADNFNARYTANDLCLRHATPLVDGSVLEMEGQLSVFCTKDGPCYRCLYPQVPPAGIAPSCIMAGVLGVVPGVVGTLQALEAIKLITGIGEPLVGRLLNFDARTSQFRQIEFARESECRCAEMTIPA